MPSQSVEQLEQTVLRLNRMVMENERDIENIRASGLEFFPGMIKAGARTVVISKTGIVMDNNLTAKFAFKDSSGGADTIYMGSTSADRMFFRNKVVGGGFGFTVDLDGGSTPQLIYREDPGQTDRTILEVPAGEQGGKITLGGSDVVIGSIGTSGGPSETVFNDNQEDIDFRVEGDAVDDVFKVDAGLDQILAGTTIAIKERADQQADIAGYGQLWVKNTSPCELWFTDDTGTDTQLA